MDYIPPREQVYAGDLELGNPTIEESPSTSPSPSLGTNLANTFISKFRDFVINEAENGAVSSGDIENKGEVSPESLKLVVENKVDGEEEKKIGKKKAKKGSAKKPPRPPRGLSLDATDQKLIREIAEIAMLKRARIERMKALKKMKASKASSSSSGSLFAMLFTLLFCLVILFQGMSSGNSGVGFQGSPESAQAKVGGGFVFVSKSNHWNPYATKTDTPGSGSPSILEQAGSLNSKHSDVSRAAR